MLDFLTRIWHTLQAVSRRGFCLHRDENLVRRFRDDRVFTECVCGWESNGWFCPDKVYVGRSRVGQ